MLKQGYATWQCGSFEISLTRPRIMGILNVTPDSFSDGGDYLDVDAAVARAKEMLDEGADIIDVGGESTRPGHVPISAKEEAERVVPVVRRLVALGAPVSIDTRHADVAKMCVRLGASIVNDVSGFTDPDMVEVAANTDCGCVVMHWDTNESKATRREVRLDSAKPSRYVPSSQRFTLPDEASVMRGVMGFLGDAARTLMRAGVAKERICVDPGAGFDKTTDEDVVIQRATRKMVSMGYPLMCAVSRKRFVGAVSGVPGPCDRDAATIGLIIHAIEAGARILRVHDVASVAQAVNAYWAVSHPDPRQGFVALGSNVGDRMAYLAEAIRLINKIPMTTVVQASRAYESDPAYGLASPVANAVVEIRSELAPLVLLDELLEIETELGRERPDVDIANGPRTIDCDLIWLEGEMHAGSKLRLPHPRIGERDFVMVPLEDLMHDPVRFLRHEGIEVLEPEERLGQVRTDLGTIDWE